VAVPDGSGPIRGGTPEEHIMNMSNTGKKLVKSALAAAVVGAGFPVMLSLGTGTASAGCQGEVYGSTHRITCSDEYTTCTYLVTPTGPSTRCVTEGGVNN
jgi:hypothetical protein